MSNGIILNGGVDDFNKEKRGTSGGTPGIGGRLQPSLGKHREIDKEHLLLRSFWNRCTDKGASDHGSMGSLYSH